MNASGCRRNKVINAIGLSARQQQGQVTSILGNWMYKNSGEALLESSAAADLAARRTEPT